ncbi:MAG: phosphodiesterase, partial [Burkholderiaceae bacterium]
LLRLRSGRLAVVAEQNPDALLKPRVVVFFDIASNRRLDPMDLNLGAQHCDDQVAGCESPENWPFSDLDQLWGAPDLGPA